MSDATTSFFEFDAELPEINVAILVCPPGYMPVDIIGIHTIFFGTAPPAPTSSWYGRASTKSWGYPNFPPTRPTMTFADCPPADLDIFLWTGAVSPEIFDDEETLDFLADRGSRARWVGGNCGGTLLLGAAGSCRDIAPPATSSRSTCSPPTSGRSPPPTATSSSTATASPPAPPHRKRRGRTAVGTALLRGTRSPARWSYKPSTRRSRFFGVGRPDLAGPELTQRALDHGSAMAQPYVDAIERAAKRLSAVAV